MGWDFFISYAHEDKDAVARPLADALKGKGYEVWFDEFALRVGDRLSGAINEGLAKSRFVVVILSHAFFRKQWTVTELGAVLGREDDGSKVLLPILHDIEVAEVKQHYMLLADRIFLRYSAQ